ncbi:F-box domain-containing protein [Favolaschia claudopus]|uniref:F-box domain-containing protein n=1 Tax=Favolaschia claudopus TaxID=2862362 RepID=A0AAW0DWB6_9AGAR
MRSDLPIHRAHLAEIDVEIAEVEHRLAKLRSRRAAIKEPLDAYKYPVLTLPNEIVSEIFFYASLSPPIALSDPLAPFESPILLTHVCSKWRKMVLSMPLLWSAFKLAFTQSDQKRATSRQIALARIWLKRSASCSLSLEIQHVEADNRYQPLRNFYSTLGEHSGHCGHLKISGSFRAAELLTPLLSGSMPLLRSLHFNVGHLSQPIALGDAPLLRTVTLGGRARSRVTLPWAQITSLTLLEGIFPKFIPMLQQARNLIHCELNIFLNQKHGATPELHFPRMESLTFKADVGGNPHLDIRILDCFVTPALRRLVVPDPVLGRDPFDTLSSFFANSSCTLDSLCITYDEGQARARNIMVADYRLAFPTIANISLRHKD